MSLKLTWFGTWFGRFGKVAVVKDDLATQLAVGA